jgi:hypothetical protein
MASDHFRARMTKGTTMALDRISATVTYMMWREEHLWNVSALQRLHISTLVTTNNNNNLCAAIIYEEKFNNYTKWTIITKLVVIRLLNDAVSSSEVVSLQMRWEIDHDDKRVRNKQDAVVVSFTVANFTWWDWGKAQDISQKRRDPSVSLAESLPTRIHRVTIAPVLPVHLKLCVRQDQILISSACIMYGSEGRYAKQLGNFM